MDGKKISVKTGGGVWHTIHLLVGASIERMRFDPPISLEDLIEVLSEHRDDFEAVIKKDKL